MANFWNLIWTAFLIFAFAAYLMILFSIIADLFRDRQLNGWLKALWIIFLIRVPYLTAFVYLIARGKSMAERQEEAAYRHETTRARVLDLAVASPSGEIAHAKELLDAGTITSAEFDALKAKALAR